MLFVVTLAYSYNRVLFCMAFVLREIPQLITLQSAMTHAESVVASRRNGEEVAANELQDKEVELNQSLEALLSAGFPPADPVVAEVKTLVKSVYETRIEVRPRYCTSILLLDRIHCRDVRTHSITKRQCR